MKKQTFYRIISIAMIAATLSSNSVGSLSALALTDTDISEQTAQSLPLENKSSILSENIAFGDSVTMYGSAVGGTGEYTYAYYYKQADAQNWGGFNFSSETQKSFKPTKETTYNICIKAKDSNNTVSAVYFDVEVKNTFQNLSRISTLNAAVGEEVTLYGAADGGSGQYTYSYCYKQEASSGWNSTAFTSDTSFSFSPAKESVYNICIKAKDTFGNVSSKYFDISVKNTLENTSSISAEKISLGEEVIMYGSAAGNIGDCTYAYYYKQASADSWGGFGFGTEIQKSFKPTKETTYNICIKVKDSTGNIAVKYFDVEVKNTLANMSAVNVQKVSFGEKVSVQGSARGGSGEYLYQYLYRKSSATSWSIFEDYTQNTKVDFIAEKPITYDLMVRVKDSNGITADSEIFTVEVESTFANTSTISAESISLGEEVIMYGSATGNIGDCTYAYYFKQADAEKWGGFGFSAETQKSFKPTKETTYNICIKIKDSTGTIAVKYFDVEVKNTLSNTSTVDKNKIALTEKAVMNGSAKGGSGVYLYQYLYRKSSATSWSIFEDYTQNSTVDFIAEIPATYDLMIRAKDSNGITADSEIFTVEVESTFANTSTISAESISLGEEVVMHGSATGNIGDCTYAYYFKQADAEKWGGFSFSAEIQKSFKPTKETTYNICIKVKDSTGTVSVKYFDVEVKNTIVNTSTVSDDMAALGDTVTMNGSATGGKDGYTYQYLYKPSTSSSWVILKNFSEDTSAEFIPADEGVYHLCIKVKDGNGISGESRKFTLKVKNTLVNKSSVSSLNISLGDTVQMRGSASGGSGSYTYAYYYKQDGTTKWGGFGFSEETLKSFKPTKETTYNVCIKVKDRNGTVESKYFNVVVMNTVVNTSRIEKASAICGEDIVMYGSAQGGSGVYSYAYTYKRKGDENFRIIKNYSSDGQAVFNVSEEGEYILRILVKDSNGIMADEEKLFDVTVANNMMNLSYVESAVVARGYDIVMHGRAKGGSGVYSYAYAYKKAGDKDYISCNGKGFCEDEVCSITPVNETVYNIRIKVMDSNGVLAEEKYFDVEVKNTLVNTSSIESTTVSCGEPINMHGSAQGGSGVYSYAFTYKPKNEENFKLIKNYSSENETSFSIKDEGEYIFRITVQDSNGVFADEKLFEVKVENTLVNNSYVDSEAISKGQELVMHGSAQGGSGEYTYKFFYKKPEDEKYSSKLALEDDETTAVIKPNTEATYSILIRVTDSYGKTADKYIDVKVGMPITSVSSVNSYNIKSGGTLTIKCQGQGGSGEYQYKFLYGKCDESGDIALKDMTVISEFSSQNTASVTLDEFGDYKFVSIAKDSNGSQDFKYHIVQVSELANVSKISKTLIERGSSINIYGRSTGGKGTIKYAYQYKLVTETSWKTLKSYSTKTSCIFKPAELGTYEIRVTAKDDLGTTVPKVMTLTVKKPKSEEITDAVLPNILNDSMNDFEKVTAIHDWIVNNIEYDTEHYYDEVPPAWDSTAEGAYDHRKALCGGYARLFNLLAGTAGFETKIIAGTATNASGSTEKHEWNHIKVNDEWYNVDVTWDAPAGSHITYYNLLVPDSVINENHTADKVSENCTAPQPMEYIETAMAKTISNDKGKPVYLCRNDSEIKSVLANPPAKKFQILYKSNETSPEKIRAKIKLYQPKSSSFDVSLCDYAKGYWTINLNIN